MSQKNNRRWVVGVHSVIECLRTHPEAIAEICFQDLSLIKEQPWVDLIKKIRTKPQQKAVNFFRDLSEFGHQGVAISTSHWPDEEYKIKDVSSILFLDGIEDPHNLGAILRTSWLMGTQQIFVSEKNSVKLTPTVCKVASGGAEHVPVTETHFLSEMKHLKDHGFWIYGFSEKATKTPYDVQFSQKSVFVFGSEEKGIRIPILNECDELLCIPQASVSASYNVSVSVAIALAEFSRQTLYSHKNTGK